MQKIQLPWRLFYPSCIYGEKQTNPSIPLVTEVIITHHVNTKNPSKIRPENSRIQKQYES